MIRVPPSERFIRNFLELNDPLVTSRGEHLGCLRCACCFKHGCVFVCIGKSTCPQRPKGTKFVKDYNVRD
jgi:hypothetical protein